MSLAGKECQRFVLRRAGPAGVLRTFNGRVVLVYEVALDELDGQTTLSDTTAADDDELVFPEDLQKGGSANWRGSEGREVAGARGRTGRRGEGV